MPEVYCQQWLLRGFTREKAGAGNTPLRLISCDAFIEDHSG